MMSYFTLAFWNNLTRAYLSDVTMVLAATILVLMDKPVRQLVNAVYRPKSRVMRFLVFMAVCSIGYGLLAVVTARVLRWLLLVNGGALIFPVALGVLIGVGVVAARQKQF